MIVSSGVPLTEGEVKLVRGIFGDQINTSSIRKHRYDEGCKGYPVGSYVTFGQNIASCSRRAYAQDYSQSALSMQADFMHEATHVFQVQNLFFGTGGLCIVSGEKDKKKFDYSVERKERFSQYCHEQQAAIVEDYVRRFLSPHGDGQTKWYREFGNADNDENDLFLKKVVEERFPQARMTRMEAEKNRQPDPAYGFW